MKIKNWERFQHYRNRKPPWIRLYRDLLDDPEFFELSGEAVKHLLMFWLIASEDPEMGGLLPAVKVLAFRLRTTVEKVEVSISELYHWLEPDASNTQAECPQVAPESCSDQIRDRGRSETEGEADAPARDQYTYEGDTDTDSQKIVHLIMQSFPDWDQMAVEVAVMKMRGLAIGFDFVMWQDIIARSIAVTLPEHGPQDYQITISKKINGMKIRARDAEATPGRPQPKEQAHVPDTKPQTDSERLEQARIVAEITGSGGVEAIEKRRAEKEKVGGEGL